VKKVITYIALTFFLSTIGYYLIIHSKVLGISPFLAMFYLMWCPALSGIITSLVYEKSLSGLGLKLGKLRWSVLAYFLPIVYAGVAYCVIWLSGYGGINPDYKFNFFKLIVFGTMFNVAFAAGEEIGWRGFLVPQLYKLTSYTKTCFITGIIWAVWHFPLLISGIYLARMPLGLQLILLVITVTAMTFPISWLRLKSYSVWPAILLHSSHNLYIQRFFDPLTTTTGSLTKYMVGESGIVMAIIFGIVGVIFWKLRDRLPSRNNNQGQVPS